MPERENLTMSQKERDRIKVLARVKQGELTYRLAAESLGVSERQIYRIFHRYKDEGDRGVIHRLRGRATSNRSYPQDVHATVLRLFREQYSDYHPTLFSEVLLDEHQIDVPRQTLNRWLRANGVFSGVRKNRPHRKKRERRETIGDLIQFDGSHHDWFERRGPECCLLVAIDDASGRVFLRFAESENTRDVLLTLRRYVELCGIPRQIYTDYGSVYNIPRSKRFSTRRNGEARLTDVGHALKRLGVEQIFARSPQAKGRVERSNRTHQDRLVKALRRKGISTIAEANRFLDEFYITDHNKRFALAHGLKDVHRSADGVDLKNIFCFETKRAVYNDYTITLDAQFIQLERSEGKDPSPLPAPRQSVMVRRWLPDNSLHIFWNEHELRFTPLKARPPKRSHNNPGLLATHPWRHTPPIGKRGRYLMEQRTKNSKKQKKKTVSSIPSPP
jgi:transposase